MIAVIADDFTGAAEIGGIGLRYGLKVVLLTDVEEAEEADLLVIATDTRAMPAEEAARVIKRVAPQIAQLKPDLIFKKLDSAIRGNIAVEIEAQMHVLGKQKALIVPGNPVLGRIIKNGQYQIDGVPLHRTFFSGSPGFPEGSSSVTDIISRKDIPVHSRSAGDELPERGIIVGDVESEQDLTEWAASADENCHIAGGSGIFYHILARLLSGQEVVKKESVYLGDTSVIILGSRYPKSEEILRKIYGDGTHRMNMPEEIYRNREFPEELMDQWADAVAGGIGQAGRVIISIDHKPHDEPGLSKRIRLNIGQLCRKIADRIPLGNLVIEGGATAYEIIRKLKIKKLYPVIELGPGVIQMKADGFPGLCITTKPGSYNWPDNIKFEKRQEDSSVT